MNKYFKNVISDIINNGLEVSPRGIKTKELISPRILLEDPRNRIVTFEDRNTDIFYAIGEFFWYLSGSNKLDYIQYYAPSIGKFSDDEKTLNSAYGYNIFYKWFNQWSKCIDILKKDKDSRHAVIFIREPQDLLKITKDSICTNNLSFLIRNNKLFMTVQMRSCDCCVGLIFDMFCFTMFQELMAIELQVELGEYIHIANSLHIYENWFEIANKIINNDQENISGKMKLMRFVNKNIWDEIADILKYEQMIRTESIETVNLIEEELYTTLQTSNYWADFLFVLIFKRYFKIDYNRCETIINHLEKNSHNFLFAELLRRKIVKNKTIA